MPNFNSMGPRGEGPKTGRGLGKCGGGDGAKANPKAQTFGRGQRRGTGLGREGRRRV